MIDTEELRAAYDYDAKKGALVRRRNNGHGKRAGEEIGQNASHGYRAVKIRNKQYMLHRLIWQYVHGSLPNGEIDHINGDKKDNRVENLRVASKSENQQNRYRAAAHSRSKILGVSLCKQTGRWVSQIQIDGKRMALGRFDTKEAARDAYLVAKSKL